jgi:SAM-dependent methyltransferase
VAKREHKLQLTELARSAWEAFLINGANLGHADRGLAAWDIDAHVRECWLTALATSARISKDILPLRPQTILEVGASAGLNCYALALAYPDAKIFGIEPEMEAVEVARMMRNEFPGVPPLVIRGVGENIPLPDKAVDLIVCHTVIEHVRDVPRVIAEMARVLAPGGVIHLEAPNYIWPYEPHLGVWTIPLFGKAFVQLCATLQGKGSRIDFLEHLQFVHPKILANLYACQGLQVENRAAKKIAAVFSGNADIRAYRKLAMLLRALHWFGLSHFITYALVKLGLYPSVLDTLRKGSAT